MLRRLDDRRSRNAGALDGKEAGLDLAVRRHADESAETMRLRTVAFAPSNRSVVGDGGWRAGANG